jgi:Protein of unknown function (DUF1501)
MNSIFQQSWFPKDERSRRQFIVDAAKALLGVGIAPSMGKVLAGESQSRKQRPPRASSVIYLNMMGGVSHIDTFDPKPGAPEIQGPVDSLATNVPGIHLTEFLPGLARQADKLAIIRSMTSNQGDHNAAQYFLHRSYREGGTLSHPALAVWAMRSLDKFNPDLPGSVSIASNEDSISTGFLELKYAPVPINDPKQGLPDSHRAKYVTDSRMATRIAMAQAFNEKFHGQYKYRQTSALASMFTDAVRLMSSKDLKAFDISLEPASMSQLYGPTPFGQGCMLARRLVEYGVRFIEVGLGGWDTHYDNFGGVEANAAVLDKAMSALLADLEQRGLLDTTLLVVATEFGRSPEINEAHKNGRDHHPNAFSCVLAGGGVQGGQVYGATNSQGAAVVDRKVSIPDFNATIGWALGLPIEEKFTAQSGQEFQIAAEGQPLTSLFS